MRSPSLWSALALLLVAHQAFADDGAEYLNRVAATYRQLTSFQVEAVAESTTAIADRAVPVMVHVILYFNPPDRARVDVKSRDNSLQTVMIWDGAVLTEFHKWDGSLTRTLGAGIDVEFSPERGLGMGEMLYSTIASGVSSAAIRGREVVALGTERIPCVIVDVVYGSEPTAPKYSFWISEDRAIVLKRSVQFWRDGERRAVTSSVVALTFNDKIPEGVFRFSRLSEVKKTGLQR